MNLSKTQKIIYLFIISTIFIINFSLIFAQNNLLEKLSGRILLQVEKNGEAWYIYPKTLKKYFLNRPNDAFEIMRELGLGISNVDLKKIPIGIAKDEKLDTDGDGLNDELEKTIETNISKVDTDGDGYDDQEEIINNYDPRGKNIKIITDNALAKKLSGLILLQVEKNGEAWYLNPIDKRRYFLGRPDDAFTIMKELGLGISNVDFGKLDLEKIEDLDNNDNDTSQQNKNDIPRNTSHNNQSTKLEDTSHIIQEAGIAIMNNKPQEAIKYFSDDYKGVVLDTMKYLDHEKLFLLGNIMANSELASETENIKTYKIDSFFSLGGYKVPLYFKIKKQENGEWKLTNL